MPDPRCSARSFVLLAALVSATPGCGVLNRMSGLDTVDLTRARITTMNVEVRREGKTICPREPVQMAVFLAATREGEKEQKMFETWAGRGQVNKNDKLDFSAFSFQSELGQFDKEGWFTPTPSLVATTGHEIVVRATFIPQPVVLSSTYKFKPDYACIVAAGSSGVGGTAGGPGGVGSAGKAGSFGGVMSAGDAGGDGGSGVAGTDGGTGGPGPKLHAVVTYVKTPFYEKLIAVRLTGAVDDFLLIASGHPFVLHAIGGDGGAGGTGGVGGVGGAGVAGNPGGPGGNGGHGGSGGKGGIGGVGGAIELVYDARFPDLAAAITLDVGGGKGGAGGPPGTGGVGGAGGAGIVPANYPSAAHNGDRGKFGIPGDAGAAGRAGALGTSAAHAGPVGSAFAGLADVTVLSPGGR
jgi:hypothetical protein